MSAGLAAARAVQRTAQAAVNWTRRRNPVYRDTFDRLCRDRLESAAQWAINARRPDEHLGIAEERPVPGEDMVAQAVADQMARFLERTYPHGGAERAGNTKTYGVVRAAFEVPADLPPDLRVGVFAEPRIFRAYVRFAGPGPVVTDDIVNNGILSVGVKLMGVPGPKLIDDEVATQDFLGISAPTFTTPNVVENLKLQRWLGRGAPVMYFLNPLDSHYRDLVMQGLYAKSHASPLELRYWSTTPYAFGEGRAVQFTLVPRVRGRARVPRHPGPDYLREAMVAALAVGERVFDCYVQFQVDPHRQPIENASVVWPERLSPWRRVGVLRIPPQRFDSPAQLAFAHNLSFNPWHALAEHRPLGNQNRARRVIYLETSKLRRALNGEAHVEPTGDEVFDADAAGPPTPPAPTPPPPPTAAADTPPTPPAPTPPPPPTAAADMPPTPPAPTPPPPPTAAADMPPTPPAPTPPPPPTAAADMPPHPRADPTAPTHSGGRHAADSSGGGHAADPPGGGRQAAGFPSGGDPAADPANRGDSAAHPGRRPMTIEMNVDQLRNAREEGRRLIDAGDYAGAIDALSPAAEHDPDGDVHALLAIACFMSEQYTRATEHYRQALERRPDEADWRAAYALAAANAESEVDVFVPEPHFFTREELLAPPTLAPGTLPEPLPAATVHLPGRIRRSVGDALGAVATAGMDFITRALGAVAGYRDEVWTNWYRRRLVFAILTLAYMREQLNAHNLKDVYPPGSLVGFVEPGLTPPSGVTRFRTADGSWNNLANPREGAAGTRFPRNVENSAIHAESGEQLLTPNPREVSRRLLARDGQLKEVPFLNMFAASWIQFENHDWINHADNLTNEIIEIPLAEDDPARRRFRQRAILVGRTQHDPTRRDHGETTPVTFINEVTHWWDGSQIYGSDQATQDHLRAHEGGKLRLNPDGTLPLDRSGVETTGFTRNWWVGLSMLHTLFAHEHNAICDRLAAAYPRWDDNRLFNVARLINAAVMAKIHSVEWTPAILPNAGLSDGLNANWYGLLTNLFRSGAHKHTVAAINIRNPELGGVVGNPIDKHGASFGLTEEFVEVYRLHSLLPETLRLRRLADPASVEEVDFARTRQAGSPKVTARYPLADLYYSFGNQHPGQLVLNNYPDFMRDFSIPGNPVFDLAAVDILRARERGVPRYNAFRRQLGLNPIRRIEDLTDDPESVRRLKEVYGDDAGAVERIDLMVGTLAETHRPTGFGFGETLFQIFILNATRRLQADRFYTDDFNEDTYTKEGLEWIDRADLKHVLLRNFPALANTGLANVTNAFEPWDTDERLDPARHPLRAFDRSLRPDPWRGDAYRGGR